MKTAIYIEDGTVQLVITPESDFEKNAMASFNGKELAATMFFGAFYDCRGGWIRQAAHYESYGMNRSNDADKSLILRVNTKAAPDAGPGGAG